MQIVFLDGGVDAIYSQGVRDWKVRIWSRNVKSAKEFGRRRDLQETFASLGIVKLKRSYLWVIIDLCEIP